MLFIVNGIFTTKENKMDAAFQYMQAVQRSADEWLKNMVQRATSHPWQPDQERRFVWPVFAQVPSAQVELNKNASLATRISTASLRAPVLFEQALRFYVDDFNGLYSATANVISRNAMLKRHEPFQFDPSFLNAFTGMNKILTEMIGGASKDSTTYFIEKSAQLWPAVLSGDLEQVAEFWEHQVEVLDIIVNQNPAAMRAIKAEMGCQFDDARRFVKVAETSRAVLYQVLPLKEGVVVREHGKPVIHKPPFILPENIVDLLPHQGLSYIGAFANSGTPTYFMHIRDILDTVAVQFLSEEDLLFDLKFFAERVHSIHGLKATINGICQGALPLLHGVCSPQLQLDRYVNVWIGTVPAYGLSKSKRFEDNIRMIPKSKQDLAAIMHRLPNGNNVVLGEPASLSMRLSKFGEENPLSAFLRDLKGAERGKWSPMAAAMRHYLKTIVPMPIKITEMSQCCTMLSISPEGVFPSLLFGDAVSLQYAAKKGIRLYVVAGERDDVVDLPSALAMFDIACIKNYSGASYYVIPGAGHVAPMTNCAVEGSKNFIGNVDGPLGFHLEREAEEMN
jgi:hypothetical protein